MSDSEEVLKEEPQANDSAGETPVVEQGEVLAQIGLLKRLVMLLAVACLALSVCLNFYLVHAHIQNTDAVKTLQGRIIDQSQMQQFMKRLVMDLQALSRQDKNVQALLVKHGLIRPSRTGKASTPGDIPAPVPGE